MIKGIDIAGYQPVDFAVGTNDFVCIKITEGLGYVNPNWVGQRQTARNANLVTGFYHFGRPGSMQAQADYFLSKISLRVGDWLAFDWEDAGISSADKDAWIRYVKQKTGHKVVLYCNKDFWFNRDRSGYFGDGLWIADPNSPAGHPAIQAPWIIHQYSETAGYDHDVAVFASRADMAAWAAGGSTPAVSGFDNNDAKVNWGYKNSGAGDTTDMHGYVVNTAHDVTATLALAKSLGTTASTMAKNITTLGQAVATLDAKVTAVGAKVDALQTAVTDPSGLVEAIRTELGQFEIVIQRKES